MSHLKVLIEWSLTKQQFTKIWVDVEDWEGRVDTEELVTVGMHSHPSPEGARVGVWSGAW